MKPPTTRIRVLSGLVAVGALAALVIIGPPGTARAADSGVDQITGNGDTSSAVTASWSQGLLGADNQTVVKPRDPSSPVSFMYDDFKDLKVTVSQTTNLVHQSIKVTWSGGKPTTGLFQGNYLQMMQCYGDASTGPDPENCEYGSRALLVSGQNGFAGTRVGSLCVAGSTPNPTTPPGTLDGSAGSLGCDALEPTDPSHVDPNGSAFNYSVPFIPAGTTDKIYGYATDYYDTFSSNEVEEANTGSDGKGQQFFQTQTAVQSSGLGCGLREDNGEVRNCWLVIVPRGEYKANGYKINTSDSSSISFLNDSPLGASNWAQRIQIHLGFAPLQPNCPIGSVKERQTVGTELVSRAVFSWQLALNTEANCTRLYGYTATPEASSTAQLATPGSETGLAFTTIPLGSENGGTFNGPKLLYAPVTASAMTLGFNVNLSTGYISTPIRLTPRLMAKALTQSYKFDLPEFDNNHPAPDWAKNNPNTILVDPEFRKLNPDVPTSTASSLPSAPLLTADASAVNQQMWEWILSDKAARDWLGGKADENGMAINPAFTDPTLAVTPSNTYPRAVDECFDYGMSTDSPPKDMKKCSLDLLPYVTSLDDAASRVRAGNDPEGASWDPTKIATDGTAGAWGNGGILPAGRTFLWAPVDSASLAGYGLVPADLCAADGSHCVSPDESSVATALSAAKPDSTGLLHVDPAHPGNGGYPLVDVTYAAVRMDLDAAARTDYAALINYAAGSGQTAGDGPGQLPRGYLPLPNALRSQAQAAAAQLLAGPSGSSGNPGPQPGGFSGSGRGSGGGSSGGGGNSGGGAGSGGGGSGGGGANPGGHSPTGSTALAPSVGNPPSPLPSGEVPGALASKSTPRTPPGAVRWALLVVVIAGAVGAASQPLIRLKSTLPRLRR